MKNQELLHFLYKSPTSFQAVANMRALLCENGFTELKENEDFSLTKGGKYFISRNGTSILGFKVGKRLKDPSFMIAASHSDCPSFKLKPNAILPEAHYTKLNTEVYGGPLMFPWFDRPLSLAGRLVLKDKKTIQSLPFMLEKDFCLIPSLAIHMNREANTGFALNPQVHLLPICSSDDKFDLYSYLEEEAGLKKGSLLSYDLYLYVRQEPQVWGAHEEYFSAQHIDNLECAYTSLLGFLEAEQEDSIQVYACFDNEEVGSLTRQGAASDFLVRNLHRVALALKQDPYRILGNSMLLSCDNAHASHPHHPEKDDPSNHCYMNEGIVIKFNANQSYTSDGLSTGIFVDILKKAQIPYQFYTNRSDIRGGSTLGNLSNGQVSLLSLDIGLAQLGMHSCYETAGCRDAQYMQQAVKAFLSAHLHLQTDGTFTISE